MKSNKNFFGENWISLFYGSYERPYLETPLDKILMLGEFTMTSYGMIMPCWSFYARDAFTTVSWMNFHKIFIASCSSSKKLLRSRKTSRS